MCFKRSSQRYGKKIIESKKDLIVLSVGAFSDEDYLRELQNLSNLNNTRILIPTGAIAGLGLHKECKKISEYLNHCYDKESQVTCRSTIFQELKNND